MKKRTSKPGKRNEKRTSKPGKRNEKRTLKPGTRNEKRTSKRGMKKVNIVNRAFKTRLGHILSQALVNPNEAAHATQKTPTKLSQLEAASDPEELPGIDSKEAPKSRRVEHVER